MFPLEFNPVVISGQFFSSLNIQISPSAKKITPRKTSRTLKPSIVSVLKIFNLQTIWLSFTHNVFIPPLENAMIMEEKQVYLDAKGTDKILVQA